MCRGGLKIQDRKKEDQSRTIVGKRINVGPIIPRCQKVKNAGLENAGPRQLSDSSLKPCRYSTDITISAMNVTYVYAVKVYVGKPNAVLKSQV